MTTNKLYQLYGLQVLRLACTMSKMPCDPTQVTKEQLVMLVEELGKTQEARKLYTEAVIKDAKLENN